MDAAPRFFVDVGSPYAYLAAERVEQVLPAAPVWEPVLLGAIFQVRGWGSWGQTPERRAGMEEVERRAAAYGLPPISWPEPWPGNMLLAMRAATAAA
ncbi:MAG: disulfide bond formation protein DsbA, partial [Conexibacter sp.]